MSSGGTKSPDTISRIKAGKGDFKEIDSINGIKVLEYTGASNGKIPRYSGESGYYIVVGADGQLKHLTFNKDNGIARQIDFDDGPIHAHDWIPVSTTKGIVIKRDPKSPHHDVLTSGERAHALLIIREVSSGRHKKIKLPKGMAPGQWQFL